MNSKRKLTAGFAGIVLAGTLAFGAVASAQDNGDGTGNARRHLPRMTAEQKCERHDEIVARAGEAQQKIADRLVVLQERRAAAEEAGETEAVARIDRRISRMETLSTKITARLAKFETWTVEHCTA
jgi:hypothetical protein